MLKGGLNLEDHSNRAFDLAVLWFNRLLKHHGMTSDVQLHPLSSWYIVQRRHFSNSKMVGKFGAYLQEAAVIHTPWSMLRLSTWSRPAFHNRVLASVQLTPAFLPTNDQWAGIKSGNRFYFPFFTSPNQSEVLITSVPKAHSCHDSLEPTLLSALSWYLFVKKYC